jgi:hypothetical protein
MRQELSTVSVIVRQHGDQGWIYGQGLNVRAQVA